MARRPNNIHTLADLPTSSPMSGFDQYIKPYFADLSTNLATFKIMVTLAIVYVIQLIVNFFV